MYTVDKVDPRFFHEEQARATRGRYESTEDAGGELPGLVRGAHDLQSEGCLRSDAPGFFPYPKPERASLHHLSG